MPKVTKKVKMSFTKSEVKEMTLISAGEYVVANAKNLCIVSSPENSEEYITLYFDLDDPG
jgi:hypothetical protein